PGWNHGILWYHHDAVTDEVIVCVQVRRLTFRRNDNAITDARVLIDNRAVNHAIAPDSDRYLAGILKPILLKIIRAHDDAVPDGRAALNNTAYAHNASLQMRVRDDAAI